MRYASPAQFIDLIGEIPLKAFLAALAISVLLSPLACSDDESGGSSAALGAVEAFSAFRSILEDESAAACLQVGERTNFECQCPADGSITAEYDASSAPPTGPILRSLLNCQVEDPSVPGETLAFTGGIQQDLNGPANPTPKPPEAFALLDGSLGDNTEGNNGSATQIRLSTTDGFPSLLGSIIIGTERITYFIIGPDEPELLGITRGAFGTTITGHPNLAAVETTRPTLTTALLDGALAENLEGNNGSVDQIRLNSTTGFPDSGTIRIGIEDIAYTGLNGLELTGIVRASFGTPLAPHANSAQVDLLDALCTAAEASLGQCPVVNLTEAPFTAPPYFDIRFNMVPGGNCEGFSGEFAQTDANSCSGYLEVSCGSNAARCNVPTDCSEMTAADCS